MLRASVLAVVVWLSWLLLAAQAQTQTWYMCAILQGATYQSIDQATLVVNSTSQLLSDYNGQLNPAFTALSLVSGSRTFTSLTAANPTPQVNTMTALAAPGSTGGNDNLFWPASNPPLDGNGLTFNFSYAVPITGQISVGTQMNLWWASGSNSLDEETAGGTHETSPLVSTITFSTTNSACNPPTQAQFSFCLIVLGSGYSAADSGIFTTAGAATAVAASTANKLTATQQGWLVTAVSGQRVYSVSGAATTSAFSSVATAASVSGNDNYIYPTYSQLLDGNGVGLSFSSAVSVPGQSSASSIALQGTAPGVYVEATAAGAETTPSASYMQIAPYLSGQPVAPCSLTIPTVYTFCWSVQSPKFTSFVSGTLTINPAALIVTGNTGNQVGYQVVAATGSRTYTNLVTTTTTVSTVLNLMPANSVGGNDNYLLLGSWPLLDGDGITLNFSSIPPIFGQSAATAQTTQMNMWWTGSTMDEENEGGTHEVNITSSSFSVTAASSSSPTVPSCQFYLQPLGWYADSTAQTQLSENNQATNDLHCDPPQTYSSLPAAGAYFESFSTYYDASSVGTVNGVAPVVRMALYQIVNGVWTLVVGTQSGSDLALVPGSASGGTLATSTGPFYYPPNSTLPVVIYPSAQYALCFSNNAITIGTTAHMFLWPQGGGLVNYALEPYYMSSALPTVYNAAAAAQSGATDTWQVWMTVAAPGAGPATGGTPTPAPAVPLDYNSVCYGAYLLNPQNVVTFNYQYTLGCTPGLSNGWTAPSGGTGCTGATNGTGASFMVVNITLVMLLSSSSVYGSGANTAYQICSLLPGSTRTIGTWINAQSGLQWQSTSLQIVQNPSPGSCSGAISLCSNNWYYPNSGTNNPNGPASTTPYGLPYYFDGYGILYTLGQSWNGITYLNLFTSSSDGANWVITQGGTQLMEENGQGPFGVVTENSWKITTTTAPWTGCSSLAAGTPMTTWTWNYGYTAVCSPPFNYTGCSSSGGYYTVNYTLIIQTVSTPVFDNGVNSPFMICALLPGSTRTQTMNPTGSSATTTTTAVTLAGISSASSWYYNNYFYPFSASNGATGNADGALGLYFYFDNYGAVIQFTTPQTIGGTSMTQINLCTGNGAVSGGSQLMEETSSGQFGLIPNNQSWYVSVSPSQAFTPGACPSSAGSQVVHIFTFNLVYQSQCTAAAALPGCSAGTASVGFDKGYYTLNLTLVMITGVIPALNAVGPNAGYRTCSLLPGSQRTTATSLTGGLPQVQTTPLTLLYNPVANGYSSQNVQPSGIFYYDNFFYPYSYVFGEWGGGLTSTVNTGYDNPNAYGAEFFFDNFGMVYLPSTPWLGVYPYINLCTSNPVTNSLNPDQLTEEDPVSGPVGVVNGWTVSVTSQRFAQQSSFYFSYSAMGPLTVSSTVTTPWATVISGVATVIATSTSNVYQVIALYATRSSTNFQQTVTGSISLVGVGLAGNNNNLLYVNSSQFPLGMDGQGWGYSSNTSALFPTSSSTANTVAAGTVVQLVNGVLENVNGQSTAYSNPSMTLTAWSSTATAPSASLPTSAVVATYSNSTGSNNTVTVTVYVNQTVTQTVYVPVNGSSSSSSGSSLSNGAIAGIVIGCSIGLSLLCVLCVLLFVVRGRDGKQDSQQPRNATRSQPLEESSTLESSRVDIVKPEVEMQ